MKSNKEKRNTKLKIVGLVISMIIAITVIFDLLPELIRLLI
ncbi:MAG: hypothetical protein O6761_08250 [Thaumarchaeota archaeon]|nr:hypothetical protein [Nitrososphaerota archaeon]GFN39966.1 MAG: hypothetical protein YK1309IOTA_1020004 [Marine Group I thaumarchaeote]